MKMGAMNTLALLLLICATVQLAATSCVANDGSCTWTEPVLCPESNCKGASCLIVTQSINASYPSEFSSGIDQQYQCHCPSTNDCTDDANVESGNSTEPVVKLSFPDGILMNIIYAEMWRCFDDSSDPAALGPGSEFGCEKTPQLLPNVLALVRYWCQDKPSCEVDPLLVMSHVGQPNVPSTPPGEYVITWRIGKMSDLLPPTQCDGFYYDNSCYRLTPRNLNWNEARSFCLRRGGDLAHFTDRTNFTTILRNLDSSIPILVEKEAAIPIWFKWYSWTGEQREPKHFIEYTENFQCGVYDFIGDGVVVSNPLVNCYIGKTSKKVRGLCALPLVPNQAPLKTIKCPSKCISGYLEYCWEEAEPDTVVTKECPVDTSGNQLSGSATWVCGIDGQWTTPLPDFSKCTNPVVEGSITTANDELNSGKNPSSALGTLTTEINKVELASGNLVQLDQTVRLAIEKQTELLLLESDPDVRDASSKNFTLTVAGLNDVILSNEVAFWGLPPINRDEEIDNVQKNVDDTLFLLADNLQDTEKPFVKQETNLAIQVENRNKDYNDKSYPFVAGEKDQLILPAGFPDAVNDTTTRLYFVDYPTIQNLLHGDTLTQWELEADENVTAKPIKQAVVSRMLGATLGQPNQSVQFVNGKVEILLSTLNFDRYDVNRESARCAYWNNQEKDWAFDGCEIVHTKDKSVTRCRCDHLTNFAVLMDINGIFQNQTIPALDYITIIGESISIACLSLAILIFYGVRTLRHDFRFHIHRNLCLNLLVAEILLLAGIDATENQDLCLSIAVFLHFFFLCAFGWMFVEGLYMYFLITKVFEGSGLKRWQYYIIGYGLPVLVVSITLGVTNTSAYKNPSYCWLSYDDGAIWAFAGPVAGVILANFVFLSIALSVAFKSRRRNQGAKRKYGFRWIFGMISLTFILGITWFFGFFYFTQKSIVFAYIYTVLNAFQGVMVFFIFIVLSKQVRKDLHRQIVTSETFQDLARCFNIEIDTSHPNSRTKDSQSNRTNNSRELLDQHTNRRTYSTDGF